MYPVVITLNPYLQNSSFNNLSQRVYFSKIHYSTQAPSYFLLNASLTSGSLFQYANATNQARAIHRKPS